MVRLQVDPKPPESYLCALDTVSPCFIHLCVFLHYTDAGTFILSTIHKVPSSVQFTSVQSLSRVRLCDPMNCSTPGLPVHHQLPSSPNLMSIESVMPSSHLILCRPLLLLPPIPPSIRVSSIESTLYIRWPKYWSFSFSISPFNEHPGLISFRMD